MWKLDYNEGWVPKNWCFELWCWRRLLRVSWTARRSNQSILKGINPEYSESLKLQSFGHLMQRTDLLEKTLMLGKIEGRKRRGWQKVRWLNGITDFIIDVSLSKLQEIVKDREAWHAAVHGVTKNRTRLSDWTRNNKNCFTVLYWSYLFTCWFIGQHESAPGTHMLRPSWASLLPPTPSCPSRSLQTTRLSSLCYTATSH